jgi:hypothetical protein
MLYEWDLTSQHFPLQSALIGLTTVLIVSI